MKERIRAMRHVRRTRPWQHGSSFLWVLLVLGAGSRLPTTKVQAWSAPTPKTTTTAANRQLPKGTAGTASNKKKKFSKIYKKTSQPQPQQPQPQQPSLAFVLQKCTTPVQVLQNVGVHLSSPSSSSVDLHGSATSSSSLASLTLVRLSKQLMTLQNEYLHGSSSRSSDDNMGDGDATETETDDKMTKTKCWNSKVNQLFSSLDTSSSDTTTTTILDQVVRTLVSAGCDNDPSATTKIKTPTNDFSMLEPIVEGTKAVAILARLMPDRVTRETCQPLLDFWSQAAGSRDTVWPAHQLSGLYWAYQCLQHVHGENNNSSSSSSNQALQLPATLQQAYQDCQLPFYIIPGFLGPFQEEDLTVDNLVAQVKFQVDTIRTTSTKRQVQERRETAWEGDEGVAPFAYSGKSMPRHPWSPLVKRIRDQLALTEQEDDDLVSVGAGSTHSGIYYDGCLLNHYPDGGSAMRYHSDPDQGVLWSFETAVVSVGASRRVAFRENTVAGASTTNSNPKAPNLQQQPHNFVVMHGDAMVMVGDCQQRFQHTVKPADDKRERAARASLVFKRTLSLREQT